MSVLQWIISKTQSKCENNLTYYKMLPVQGETHMFKGGGVLL